MIRHHEFWNPRVFEIPYYLYLLQGCLRHRLPPKFLSKANYALDHGEIGIGSKYRTQLAFDQARFLPTMLLPATYSSDQKSKAVLDFARTQAYPIIFKPDAGCVGKGIYRANSEADVRAKLTTLTGDYLVQKYSPHNNEYGVFVIRRRGEVQITGMNRKHFPTVIGDGNNNLMELARQQPRFSNHWHSFLQYFDTRRIPKKGEQIQLSFIGSHTMGCMFTDDSHLITSELQKQILAIIDSQPGFNFGRFDIKAASEAAFQQGQFVVIEVNGIASLPTHMFDPKYSLKESYRIFFKHGRHLAEIANEHRNQPMPLLSYRGIIARVKANQSSLNRAHQRLMDSK